MIKVYMVFINNGFGGVKYFQEKENAENWQLRRTSLLHTTSLHLLQFQFFISHTGAITSPYSRTFYRANPLRIRAGFDATRFDLNSQDEHEYNSL